MFEPKKNVPEWRMIYDEIVPWSVDEILTYERLNVILRRSFRDDRSPLYRVQKELLKTNQRTLVNVVGVGYRVARANEHAGLAGGQRNKARRAMTRGVRIIDGTDRNELNTNENQRLTSLEHTMKAQANILRRTTARVADLEKVTLHQDDRLDLLVRELRRKGIDVTDSSE